MTKLNREKAYKNFRNAQYNYTAQTHMEKGLTATSKIRASSKKSADALLKKNPELSEFDKKPAPKPEKRRSK